MFGKTPKSNILILGFSSKILFELEACIPPSYQSISHKIEQIPNKEELEGVLKNIPYHLIILDISGIWKGIIDLLTSLKKMANGTPILLLGDFSEKILIDELMGKGANGYLNIINFSQEIAQALHQIISGQPYVSHKEG